MIVERASSGVASVRRALERHPHVQGVTLSGAAGLEFVQAGRSRRVLVGVPEAPLYGLVELTDNNPLVCADVFSVPGPAATLALIGLGPLAAAGLITEPPAVISNQAEDEAELAVALASEGWTGGLVYHHETHDLEGVGVATCMAAIPTPSDPSEIEGLYEERFGRSFFVRADAHSEWDPALVRGMSFAVYRVAVAMDDPLSLVTVRVLASKEGKLGAAQMVHAMNVMCGFEESLAVA